MEKNKLIYISSPYSHKSKSTMNTRLLQTRQLVSNFQKQGLHVISPVLHCVETMQAYNAIKQGDNFWRDYCRNILSRCDEMYLLMMDGWEISTGIHDEELFAHSKDIPVTHFAIKYKQSRFARYLRKIYAEKSI